MKIEKIKELYDLQGEGVLLEGGQKTSYRFNDKVLKPFFGDGKIYTPLFDFLYTLDNPNYRISKPLKSRNGNYIESGYIVTEYLQGHHDDTRVKEQLSVCREFHKDLESYDYRQYITAKDPWSKAMYTIFFDKKKVELIDPIEYAFIKDLLEQITFDKDSYQIIHGDFGGNVLFDENLPPCIIDFSPNVAPKEVAEAIMICDLIAWTDNEIDIVHLLNPLEKYYMAIIAAVTFRLLAVSFNKECDLNRFKEEYVHYYPIIEYVTEQLKTKQDI